MVYFVNRFSREKDGVETEKHVGGLFESEDRDELSRMISDYFGVSRDSLEYVGCLVIVSVFEDDFGFRADDRHEGAGVTYVGRLGYEGEINWRDVERSIIINSSESNL